MWSEILRKCHLVARSLSRLRNLIFNRTKFSNVYAKASSSSSSSCSTHTASAFPTFFTEKIFSREKPFSSLTSDRTCVVRERFMLVNVSMNTASTFSPLFLSEKIFSERKNYFTEENWVKYEWKRSENPHVERAMMFMLGRRRFHFGKSVFINLALFPPSQTTELKSKLESVCQRPRHIPSRSSSWKKSQRNVINSFQAE